MSPALAQAEQERVQLILSKLSPQKSSLMDRVVVVELIGATTTKTGLKVECVLDTRTYEKGIKVTNAEMASLSITGDAFHPEWNYTIKPRRQAET